MRLLIATLLVVIGLLFSCSPAEDEKKLVIGFSQCTEGDAWRKAMHKEMIREVSFHPDIHLEIKDARNSSTKQIEHINEFIAKGVDLLIVSPNEADPVTPAVERAFEAGIPVIVVDRKTSSPNYSAYVGANNYEIGKLAGEYIAKMLGGKGKIIEIWGLRGSTPAIERHKGFLDAVESHEGIEVVAEVEGEWEKDVAMARFPKVFNAHQDVDLVLAHNDVMAVGAYESIKDSKPDNLKFIGFDGLAGPNGGLQFVDDRILDATFLYPTGGEEVIKLAYDILNNRPFKRENILNTTVIDDRNVHIMQQQANKILVQEQSIERQQHRIDEQIQLYKNQRVLLYILSGGMVVIIVLGALALQALRAKQEANKALVAKNQEVINQRNEIELMAQKADKATEAKLKFFTNISHEFRTPLTLILGPVEDALHSNISPDLKKDMLLVKQNAVRLLRLVNQLMDFRKVENKKMKLQAAEGDLVRFVREVATSFERLAKKRNISFKIKAEQRELQAYFDSDKLDKVLFNLLSNAFKFTSDGGQISVTLALTEDCRNASVVVEDNGKGMSPVQAEHAFDRFYSGDTSSLSTGLGLALSKEFIKLHKGHISVSSEERKGTRFHILLPLGHSHLAPEEIVAPEADRQVAQLVQGVLAQDQEVYSESYTADEGARLKEHTVLVIEDNKELRDFLKKRLEREFNVVDAPNGVIGLNQAFETVPDLIISDVMLPGQSGLEITAVLKNDLRTSHIPVILLTAKDTIDQKIEGVQSGADLYITKPFSYLYLYERVKGLIKNRELLKEHYSSVVAVDATKAPTPPKQLEKKFLNEVMAVVEQNLSNPDLNANSIAESLGMSRVQVYRKMKALLGYSVNDYVVQARLKKARHLLLHSKKNISEIAYEVGFSSPAYFSTAFKNHFNMSPSDFKAERTLKEESIG